MSRDDDLQALYEAFAVVIRRSQWLSADLHPTLSLAAFTMLSHVSTRPDVRSQDLARHFGLDKSTVSRQVDQLVEDGLVLRSGERPGRRGTVLELTPAGHTLLDVAAAEVRATLAVRLEGWEQSKIVRLTDALEDFNRAMDPLRSGPEQDRADCV